MKMSIFEMYSNGGAYNSRIPFENFTFNKNTGLYTGTIQSARSFFTLDGEIRIVNSKTIKIKGTRLFMTKTFTLKKI